MSDQSDGGTDVRGIKTMSNRLSEGRPESTQVYSKLREKDPTALKGAITRSKALSAPDHGDLNERLKKERQRSSVRYARARAYPKLSKDPAVLKGATTTRSSDDLSPPDYVGRRKSSAKKPWFFQRRQRSSAFSSVTDFRYHIVRRGATSDKPAVECIVAYQYGDKESHQLVEKQLKNKSSGIWSELQKIPASTARAILQEQEEPVLHQPRQTGDTSQHSQTGIHKVAAGSGIVLPTTSTGDGASVHKSMIVITDSVWLSSHDYDMFGYGMCGLQKLVQQAENKGYKTTFVIFNCHRYNRQAIHRLQRLPDTLFILLDTEPKPANVIIDVFNFVLESADMDIRHKRLLNNFGPIQHAILTSSRDPQQGVHVVYGTDSIDFVLSNIKQELETRTGLRLVLPSLKHDVLPVKESPFLATLALCRNTLVVLDYEVHENTLQQTVKEAEHPDGRTVFIQRERRCPDWVLNKLETSTLMIYPHDAGRQLNRKTDFWTTVAAFLESADMDTRHKRLLNNFGPIRHAILTSSRDPQQGVHVVYGTDSTDFVLSNMKQELETRTGLRLVLPDLKHGVLSVKESPFLATLALCRNTLVVLDDTLDEVHENTLQQAVKEAEHPDGRTMFIQRGRRCPDWVLNKLATCTLMINPHDAGHHLNRETDFWATVGAFLESADMDTLHQRLLNNFGPIRHAILTSSRDPQQGVHVVYDIDNTDFVLSNMKQELETLTGLRLVLPDLKHDVLSVKESPFLATLALCRNMLVIFDDDDTLDEMYENLLQQAVKEAEHPDGRTVFIQRGRRCPDWVLNKLETSTLMIYPHDAGHQFNRKTDFWATVAAFLEDVDTDPQQRSLLNSFGPLRHALLTSPDDPQRGAHVVYDADSSNFVLTELKPEMEKRTRLTLILPDMNHNPISEQEDQLDVEHNTLSVKGNEFLAKLASCRKTCVVFCADRSPFPTFLQRAMSRRDVYGNILEQAVKEAEHAGSQIVFLQRGETCPDWVLNRLETCTVMVYPNYRGQLGQTARFWRALAEVFETSDMDLHHQRLLNSFGPVRHAALTSSRDPQQGVHVVYDAESSNFVLTELKEEMEKRTGLRLVLPHMEHKALSEKGNQPDTTLTMQGNDFCATVTLCRKTCVVLGLNYPRCGVYDKMMQQAVLEAKHPDIQTVFLQRGETCPGWVLDRQDTCTVIKYPQSNFFRMFPCVVRKGVWERLTAFVESKIKIRNVGSDVAKQTGETRDKQPTQHQCPGLSGEDNSHGKLELTSENCGSEYSETPSSQSFPVKFIGPGTNPDTDEGQQTQPLSLQPPGFVSTAPQPQSQIPSADDTSEGKSATDALRVQNQTPLQPIFSSEWQTVDTVTRSGGTVRKQYSDVILTVPSDAVDEDSQADIHTAVCTDVDRVRRVVKLSKDECVSSPVAEYWAGHEFRFKKPVTITLPHFLPPDPDPSLVRVYRVTRRPDGEIASTRLRPQATSSIDATPVNEHGVGTDYPAVWEEAATFQLTTAGHVLIVTDHFCGFVCTYCGRHGPPVLNVLACGTLTQKSTDIKTAQVSAHVWDGRIHIADCRQDYGIGIQNHILCSRTLDVLPELVDSRLYMRLVISRLSKNDWQHSLGDTDLPLIPVQQRHDLRHVLSTCDTRDCRNSSHITRPISVYWMLETLPDRHPQPWLQCAVYVCQVASNTEPSWSDREGVERSATLPVELTKQVVHTVKEKVQVESSTQTANQKTQVESGTQTDDKGNLAYQSFPSDNGNAVSHSMPQDMSGAAGHQNGQDNTRVKQRLSDTHTHAMNGRSHSPEVAMVEQMDHITASFQRHFTSSQNTENPTSGAANFAQINYSFPKGQSDDARRSQQCLAVTPSHAHGERDGRDRTSVSDVLHHAVSSAAGAVGGSSYSVVNQHFYINQPMTNLIGKIQGETTNLASTVTSNHGAPPGSGLNPPANALPNNEGNNSQSPALQARGGHERNGLEYERNGLEYERNGPEYKGNDPEYERNGLEHERIGLERVHENEAAQLENGMEQDPQNGKHLTDTNNPVCSPEEDQM